MKRLALLAGLLLFFSCEEEDILTAQEEVSKFTGDWVEYKWVETEYDGLDTLTGTKGFVDQSTFNDTTYKRGLRFTGDTIQDYWNLVFQDQSEKDKYGDQLLICQYTDLQLLDNGGISGTIKDDHGAVVRSDTLGTYELEGDALVNTMFYYKAPREFTVKKRYYSRLALPLPWWEDSVVFDQD